MKQLHILFATLMGLVGTAHATTYYCSPTGTGNGDSYSTPCSFEKGLNRVSLPGDTLYLLGGQYNLGETPLTRNGSSSRMLVIAGYPGEKAILDFRTVPYGKRGLKIGENSSYVHIKDLTLRYSGKNNLYCEGSYCRFENLDIYGSADTGCQMKKGGNNLIINCDSHDNFDYENGGLTGADFGGNADGFADKQFSGAPNRYIGCRAWNNSDDGWDFFQRVSTSATIIDSCICYKNGPREYDMRNHPRYQTDKAWFDQFTNGKEVTDRYGDKKTVTLEHYTNWGNGNGFKMGGNYTNHIVTIQHCLSVANTVKGFDQNNNDGTMVLYNNTGYMNGNDYGFTTSYGTLTIQNCLSYLSKGSNSHRAKNTLVDSYNSWNTTGVNIQASDFVSLDTTQILAARQADGRITTGTLLHPTENASFKNQGTDVRLRYYGSAPDLGCYEYIEGEPIDPDPDPKPDPEDTTGIKIAYVTLPNAEADKALLAYLKTDTTFYFKVMDANDVLDLTGCEAVILSPVPKSSALGAKSLQETTLPFVCLKPFMGKTEVWNWCTATNTTSNAIIPTDLTHSLYTYPHTLTESPLSLYNQVSTNGVATMSNWQITPITTLATCNGQDAVVEHENMIMIGLSEYSMAQISEQGKQLVHNALYHVMGYQPTGLDKVASPATNTKIIYRGQVYLIRNHRWYNLLGQPIHQACQ
ncbi:MAG: hypothetical protein MJZ48_01405 [Paludibacteraceae bacterium]|nr:hypothetical protein [Paludibacteraceae bacterium]